jgi:hypothetical protein
LPKIARDLMEFLPQVALLTNGFGLALCSPLELPFLTLMLPFDPAICSNGIPLSDQVAVSRPFSKLSLLC